jgi:hypothetical protein
VKRLFQSIAVVLLVLWVPITAHCTLESIPGLEFLKCITDAPEESNKCDEDACSQLENATYKVPDSHAILLPPVFVTCCAFLVVEFPVDEQPTTVIKTPPEILSSWQFSLRTALSPRAPSIVS